MVYIEESVFDLTKLIPFPLGSLSPCDDPVPLLGAGSNST